MQALRQLGGGFFIGLLSIVLVIGGISLALTESNATPQPTPTIRPVEFASPAFTVTSPVSVNSNPTSPAPASPTSNVACSIPTGWIPLTVNATDTLYSIAQRYGTSVEEINEKNCLNFVNPPSGSIIYVPSIPTKVVAQCGPPSGWVKTHSVKAGENLYRIALSYRITYPQLQAGNCMGTSTVILVGQLLWVPNVPTSTPLATLTNTITQTPTNTAVNTPDFSTPSATLIVTASPSSTPSITPLPESSP